MPTQLILSYTAYAYATVPNDIARKMKDGSIEWWSKWGDIYYIDEKGEQQKIDGHEGNPDYKRHEGHEWDDEVEEDEEESEEESDEESGDDERMIHDRLDWIRHYSKDKHEGCDEEDCPGQTCQYNQLCAHCDCVMSKKVHTYGLEYKFNGRPDQSTMVCSDCFYDLVEGMRDENQITKHWVVDGNVDWETDETYST